MHKACDELRWNYMSKCHRISWEGHDVGSTVAESLLPLRVQLRNKLNL